MVRSDVLRCVLGFVLADAVATPHDTEPYNRGREVRTMTEKGTYNLERGTWSSVSSLMLCCMDSLSDGIDYDDMMQKMVKWFESDYMTSGGEAFGVDAVVLRAILAYIVDKVPATKCGKTYDFDGVNSAVTRVLPLVFATYKLGFKERFEIVHNVCKMTNSDKKSMLACDFYVSLLINILNNPDKKRGIIFRNTVKEFYLFYLNDKEFAPYLSSCRKIFYTGNPDKSGDVLGEVDNSIDALEVALHCFFADDNYRGCVLKAVNLGDETIATATLVGAIASAYYKKEEFSGFWIGQLRGKDLIKKVCRKFSEKYIDEDEQEEVTEE